MPSGADLRSEISIVVNFRDHPLAKPNKKRVGGGEIPEFSRRDGSFLVQEIFFFLFT